MGLPSGTSYFVPIVVNRSKIAEAATNFLYQIDFSSKLISDPVFKGHITTASNVAVYDVDLDSIRPRKVVVDLTNNKLFIYWDGAASISIDKTFYICVGSGISQVDSASAFTNSGFQQYFALNEAAGASSAQDYVGAATGSLITSPTFGATGKFGSACNFSSSAGNTILSSVAPPLTFTYEFIIYYTGHVSNRNHLCGNWNGSGHLILIGADNSIYYYNGGVGTAGSLLLNAWNHIVVTRTATGVLYIYVNGVRTTNGITVTTPTGTGFHIGSGIGSGAGYNNIIDEASVRTVILSQDGAISRYNMLMTPSLFWTLDTGTLVSNTPLPTTAKAWKKITIQKSQVGEATDHFLHQYNLSDAMLDVNWRKHWNSAANVMVFDPQRGELRPRKVIVDGATNKLLVYFDGALSKLVDYVFYVATGLDINESDSATAFTLSNITNFWGFNEAAGATTALDMVGGVVTNITAPAATGSACKFDGGATFTGSISQRIEMASELIGIGERTISMIVRPTVESGSLILLDNGEVSISLVTSGATKRIYYTSNAPAYLSNVAEDIIANNTYLVTITRTVTGVAIIYINGLQKAAGTSGTPVVGTSVLRLGLSVLNGSPFTGFIDEFYLTNDIKTIQNELSRYNMLFNTNVFAGISGVLLPSKLKHHSIHTGVSVSI